MASQNLQSPQQRSRGRPRKKLHWSKRKALEEQEHQGKDAEKFGENNDRVGEELDAEKERTRVNEEVDEVAEVVKETEKACHKEDENPLKGTGEDKLGYKVFAGGNEEAGIDDIDDSGVDEEFGKKEGAEKEKVDSSGAPREGMGGGCVRVSIFDQSIESFFASIHDIAKATGTYAEVSFEPDVIRRLSSAITFLMEWKYFHYQPRTIRFAHETLSSHEKDFTDVNLPQFSAANIPKIDTQFNDGSFGNFSTDFVFNVGGHVWGLDWCPRNYKAPVRDMKCEYLAVSAHPPDSSYHKMGVPLIGRGLIQIWYVPNHDDELTLPHVKSSRKRRNVRSNSIADSVTTHGGLSKEVMVPCKLGLKVDRIERMTERASISLHANDINSPKLILCLAHNAKVAWDLKWRPYCANDPGYSYRMGYLAVLLGNGSLEVWEVPTPMAIKVLYDSINKVGTDPRFVKLDPVFRSSKVMRGDNQSIPLTVEWSTSAPHDLLLAGCHDGTIALWKFSTSSILEDSRPLLCFSADTVAIRALAWAPDEGEIESANLIAVATHEGLRFWDIRDPYRPLWNLNVRRVLSLDWLHNPRCVILSVDDGTLRLVSISRAANNVPVTGVPFVGKPLQGFHCLPCSSFPIWSVHVSRSSGEVAYCGANGTAIHFQLTDKAVEKDPFRYKTPHFLCGSLTLDGSMLTINTPSPNVPISTKKLPNEHSISVAGSQSSFVQSKGQHGQTLGSATLKRPLEKVKKAAGCRNTQGLHAGEMDTPAGEGEAESNAHRGRATPLDPKHQSKYDIFPSKMVSMHRVRWNMNKGSERLVCYGGAAGLVRCQIIDELPSRKTKPLGSIKRCMGRL